MDTQAAIRDATGKALFLCGGRLCLDFANTVEPRGGPAPAVPTGALIREYLPDYLALVAWARYVGALEEGAAEGLRDAAERRPDEAHAVHEHAIALREAIYRVFWAVAHGQPPASDHLAFLARAHADGAMHATLLPAGTSFAWGWSPGDATLARPLWPVAWSATALLTSGDPDRVKACPGTSEQAIPCGWLFYDTTKNRIRQWCTMADCGGKAKALRQTSRRRAARATARR